MFGHVQVNKEVFMQPLARAATRLVLFGPPCCGKGTLAPRLVQRLQIPHISTGEIFRTHMKGHSHFGEEIKHCMQEGNFVPDDLVTRVTFEVLSKTSRRFLLDGYPRNVKQAETLAKEYGWPDVVHLEADDDTIINRLVNRINCSCCGLVFNQLFNPPKIENTCDSCGGELYKRDDDTIEIAQQRLKKYHTETEPVIALFQRNCAVIKIHTGNLTPDEITHRVMEEIVLE